MVARRNVPKELSCSIMLTRSFRPGACSVPPFELGTTADEDLDDRAAPPLASCSTECKTPAASDSWSTLTNFPQAHYAIERVRGARC